MLSFPILFFSALFLYLSLLLYPHNFLSCCHPSDSNGVTKLYIHLHVVVFLFVLLLEKNKHVTDFYYLLLVDTICFPLLILILVQSMPIATLECVSLSRAQITWFAINTDWISVIYVDKSINCRQTSTHRILLNGQRIIVKAKCPSLLNSFQWNGISFDSGALTDHHWYIIAVEILPGGKRKLKTLKMLKSSLFRHYYTF